MIEQLPFLQGPDLNKLTFTLAYVDFMLATRLEVVGIGSEGFTLPVMSCLTDPEEYFGLWVRPMCLCCVYVCVAHWPSVENHVLIHWLCLISQGNRHTR